MDRPIADRSARSPAARRAPPGPRELPLVGSVVGLARDPLDFLLQLSRRHGDAVQFHLPGQRVYLFNHPDAIEQILVTHRDRLIKDKLTRQLSLLLGRGLLVSEGELWRKQRRLAQPAFHRQRVEAYGAAMVRHAERTAASWRDGETRDVHREMMRLTLDIVAETLFGVEIAGASRRIEHALGVLAERFSGVGMYVPMGLPVPGNVRARQALATLDEVVYGIIRERRASADRGDLISMLLAASDGEHGAMDDTQVRDEAVTLLLAGHETTALALTFAFHLLGEHPAAADKLREEIRDVLGDRPATAADLPRLRFADAVVRESMRLYPPAWAIGREAVEPCTVGGYHVAAGTQLWAAQWVVHRDARWFPQPEAFRPERWENDLAKTLPRYAYLPFGGGPRVCIGNAFAMMEAVLILVTIARRFRPTPPAGSRLELVPSVTLRPKHGLPMHLAR